ncbi:MAG: hypothetical protein ACFCGT_02575 [Sandaracinaceae bacterium]
MTAAPSLALECQQCGSALVVTASQRTARCAYCASPSVVERPPTRDRPTAAFTLAFVVQPERALAIARRWVRRPLLAPEAFRRAKVAEIQGLYLPAYLYSAAVYSEFSARIGENYTVTETYQQNGKTKTRTRTKTEWRDLAGRHATYVSDRVVTASRGIPNPELEAVEPFDLRAMHRHTPKLISGWAAEEPSMPLEACRAMAREEALAEVGRQLRAFMPGDKHRDLQYRSRMEQEDLALILLPVWVLPVRYRADKPPVRLLVNGQTARIHGKPPTSWLKVTLLVVVVLLLLVGVAAVVFGGAALLGAA